MRISDKEGAAICSAVENDVVLKTLDLSNNDLGEKTSIALNGALLSNLTLTDLNLSWNKLRAKGVSQIAQGLVPNLGLQYLGMAWCGMQDAGAEAFGAMLKSNQVSLFGTERNPLQRYSLPRIASLICCLDYPCVASGSC